MTDPPLGSQVRSRTEGFWYVETPPVWSEKKGSSTRFALLGLWGFHFAPMRAHAPCAPSDGPVDNRFEGNSSEGGIAGFGILRHSDGKH